MAEQTLAAICARVRSVLEASPLSLVPTSEAFSHDRQPTTLLDNTYYLEDAGLQNSRPVGNYKAVRIDRLRMFVALKINGEPHTRKDTLETTLLAIERAIKADGPAQSYHAEIASPGRQLTHRKGTDFLVGSLTLTVDYDVSES